MSAFLKNFQTTKLELQTIKIVLGDKKMMITLRAPAHVQRFCLRDLVQVYTAPQSFHL